MMNIRTLKLTNLGRFEELDVHLAPVEEFKSNVTVFIGNNGAGKTSILKSLATSLSWFVARVRTEKGNGSPIPEDAILNGRSSATIELQVLNTHPATEAATPYRWLLARTTSGKNRPPPPACKRPANWLRFIEINTPRIAGHPSRLSPSIP